MMFRDKLNQFYTAIKFNQMFAFRLNWRYQIVYIKVGNRKFQTVFLFQMFEWIKQNRTLFIGNCTEIGANHQQASDLQESHRHFATNSMVG